MSLIGPDRQISPPKINLDVCLNNLEAYAQSFDAFGDTKEPAKVMTQITLHFYAQRAILRVRRYNYNHPKVDAIRVLESSTANHIEAVRQRVLSAREKAGYHT